MFHLIFDFRSIQAMPCLSFRESDIAVPFIDLSNVMSKEASTSERGVTKRCRGVIVTRKQQLRKDRSSAISIAFNNAGCRADMVIRPR